MDDIRAMVQNAEAELMRSTDLAGGDEADQSLAALHAMRSIAFSLLVLARRP